MHNHTQGAPAPSGYLVFEGTELSIIDHNGQPWLAAADLARALGYSRADKVSRLYRENSDEFTSGMTETITLSSGGSSENTDSGFSGNLTKTVRIFSPRGCHLLAMFARTDKAKHFRKWVLDVLDKIYMHPPADRASYQLREQLSAAIRSVTVGFRSKGASYAINERIRNHFGVRRVEDLTTRQAQDAIFMVEQLRPITQRWVKAMNRAEKDFIRQVLKVETGPMLSAPTLVCLDIDSNGIVNPLHHPELDKLQKANRGMHDMLALFQEEE
ncbi:hypothetical protein Q673_02830 [Marinobacter sp. EN3]|uniref:BRO-N domain-containing protein n=1 Tax=Marinobacter sp. EN3 TaxID=1397533 RepID=UPI0003B8A2EF|nr:BRO family protein [Marinobacter sp. EN3]ERS12563.1 hypothetical protein Q673_02830 [Marinobacter sp. EN3]